jgi:hypothetical protein
LLIRYHCAQRQTIPAILFVPNAIGRVADNPDGVERSAQKFRFVETRA